MDWNELFKTLGTSIPVVIVLAWGWMRAEKRADDMLAKRDADNKSWADRYADLVGQCYGSEKPYVDKNKVME